MGQSVYYGLKDSSGNIIEKGWTASTLPTLSLFGLNVNSGQWLHCYVNSAAGIRTADTLYSSGIGGPAWQNLYKGSTLAVYSSYYKAKYTYYNITRNIAGYSQPLSQNIGEGSIVYDINSATQYTVCTYVVKDKYTVTVKKCLDNGTQSTVSTTTYEDGDTAKVNIPAAYSNSVLTGVLINNGSQTYKSGGYSFTVSGNTTVLFKFTSTVNITLKIGTGGGSLSGSSTTSFTGVTTSKSITSGTGSFAVEKGRTISLTAGAATNYVLYANAITSSSGNYGTVTGNGTQSVSTSKTCVDATTFTVNGQQFKITPALASSVFNGWGTPKIKKSSDSAWSTGAVVLMPNTTYNLGFDSATAATLAAVVDYWTIGGSNYTTTFTTGNNVSNDITAYLYLKQTKWQLTVNASMADSRWGTVSGGGWYEKDQYVTVTFTPSSSFANIAPTAYQVNYNGSTTACGNSATIKTAANSLEATLYVKQTKFRIDLAFGTSGTSGWGTIQHRVHGTSAWTQDPIYVGSNSSVDVKFTPAAAYVSSIHPKVNHWLLIDQTVTPTSADDGSSEATISVGTITQSATAYCYLESSWRKVTIVRGDSLPAAWGNFYLDASGTTTEKYYAPGSTITMRFVRNTSYDANVRPQVNGIAIGTESEIVGVDGTFSYTYTLPSNTKTDLVITATMKQTAWPVSVTTDGNGSLTVKRMQVGGGVIATVTASNSTAQTIYVRPGTTYEYLSATVSPVTHFGFSAYSSNNLTQIAAGQYALSSNAAGTLSASFARSDFKITCTSDDAVRANAYLQSDAKTEGYFDKTTTQNPVVICKLKSDYARDYKVASWSIGAQHDITPQYNAQGDFYYVEVTSRTDVVVTAHIVRTSFNLNVNIGPANKDQFGTIIVNGGGQQLSEGDYSGVLREGTHVEIVFYQKYGGRVLQIQPSQEIASPAITDSSISFDMPSADCGVNITLGAKETYQLTIGVVNIASGEQGNTPATLTLRSRTYSGIVIGSTADDGVAKTFTVYKDEEYTIFAQGVSEYLSRRYRFTGWKDETGQFIEGADDDSINILNNTTTDKTRTAVYNLRDTGTVTIEYAKKDGGVITTLDEIPDGCSFTLNNTKDKTDETHWLVGSDIKMPYTVMGTGYDLEGDAYKWTPIEVDVALTNEEYAANATWDDGLLTQDGEFTMRGNMKVRVIFVLTHVPGYTSMRTGFKMGSTALMGETSLFATEMDAYTTDSAGSKALVRKEKKVVIMAAPRPGFAFAGWFTLHEGVYTAVAGAKAVYEIPYVTSPMDVYYSEFVASTVSNVKMWNGNANANKTFDWQSKVYVGAQFFRLQSVRVYADAYPVTLKCFAASSPEDIFGDSARTCTVTINSQSPRRLPLMRPEKYFAFRVSGFARINHVGLASSMGGLYGGA